MSDGELLRLSAAEAAAAMRAGQLDPVELYRAYRQRAGADLAAGEHGLNCFTWVADDDGAAERLGSGLPLAGVPLAVKDLFCTEGVPSQAGSKILEGYRPPYTATAVARLEQAGAPLLGKCNQDEFAMGSSNETCAFGPVRNPWDRERVPGGSSGGSAAAVAAGLAPWALGTDTGGSIRQPASLCGVVGVKPTYGAVSRYGMIAFASSLDQAGPLSRNVTDAALLLRHMIGFDERDATCLHFPNHIEIPQEGDLTKTKIGVASQLSAEGGALERGVEDGVAQAFADALSLAGQLGASVRTVALPHAPHALAAYYVLAPAECSSNLARFDGVRYGLRACAVGDRDGGGQAPRPGDASGEGDPSEALFGIEAEGELIGMYARTRHDGFGAEVKRRIMLGTYALSAGYYDAYYGRAQKVRTLIADDFRKAFEQVDFILTPTSATVAFPLGAFSSDPWAMYLNDFFTVPMSLAGIPAISIPCGRSGRGLGPDGEGLPVGLQIVGPPYSESRLLQVAYVLEQALRFDGEVALA